MKKEERVIKVVFIELESFGLNAITVSAVLMIVFTIFEGWRLVKQGRQIRREKSGASMSVPAFIYFGFMLASYFVYGLATLQGVVALNGLLFILVIPTLRGLYLYKGFARSDRVWIAVFTAGLLVMIFFPVKGIMYLLFSAGVVGALVHQLYRIIKDRSVGVLDKGLIQVYWCGNIFWMIYGYRTGDWFVLSVALTAFIVLTLILAAFSTYSSTNNKEAGKMKWRLLASNTVAHIKKIFIKPWGMSAHIDLHGCDPRLVRDPEELKRFIIELCDLIEMRRYGDIDIARFGEGDKEGYSAIQKIYDSAVGVHLEETENRVFIDIFSCKSFDPDKALKYSLKFFSAKSVNCVVLSRG